jgi:hypothetical protein
MNATSKVKRTYSVEAIERMRVAARARYDSGASEAHERVRAIMKTIQTEMANNEGIYPNNKGAVSMAEVARRAQIHPFTFHKPRYKELGKEVKGWLESLKKGSVVGRVRVHKELGTRVQEWKKLYDDLLDTHRITETDLEHTQERLNESQQENKQLRQRVADQTTLKVVSIHPKATG